MIRFILIGSQISLNEGDTDFAFFSTVTDRFIAINGQSVFNSRDDFKEACSYALTSIYSAYLVRLYGLIPDNIK
jgi:hypothetical protein